MYRFVDENERLAKLIGQCASTATALEVQFALCMGSLLGIENAASVAVFATLRNAKARRDALLAAAVHSLPESDLELFRALIAVYERLDSARNDIVHGMWGEVTGEDDFVLWCSSQNYAVWHIADYHVTEIGQLTAEFRIDQWMKYNHVWSYKDIETHNDDLASLERATGAFHGYIRYRGRIQGDAALRQLTSEPLIQKALAELRSLPGKK